MEKGFAFTAHLFITGEALFEVDHLKEYYKICTKSQDGGKQRLRPIGSKELVKNPLTFACRIDILQQLPTYITDILQGSLHSIS